MPLPVRTRKFAFATLVLGAALATPTWARPVTPETLTGIAQKADLLVVAEVSAIDHGTPTTSPWNVPVLQRHATLKILRGLRPADSASVDLEQLTLQFPALAPTAMPIENGPDFPRLHVGQVALFPLKHVGDTWQFISEEDCAMVMPAATRNMNFDAPDARLLLFRELAGAFCYGDFDTMARAGRYLDMLGPDKESPVEPVFALIRHEIGDSSLHEDLRWVSIAVATYTSLMPMAAPSQRGAATFAELLDGDLPASKGLRLAALSLRKSSRFQLDQRLLMTLVNHQNDPALAPAIARTLAANFPENDSMLALEREALKEGKSSAVQVADALITARAHPLADTAVNAIRATLPPQLPDDSVSSGALLPLDDAGARAAVSLLLRVGRDADFAFLLDQLSLAQYEDPSAYQSILWAAGSRADFPAGRVLQLCRFYINDPTPLTPEPAHAGAGPFRLCDQAALLVARAAQQDFGFRPDAPLDSRDAAIDRTVEWLNAHQ